MSFLFIIYLYKNPVLLQALFWEDMMKKIAFAFLSVFMILGGVLLTACEKQVSLSVSDSQVEIYTNDNTEGDYQTKMIEVTLENSDMGIEVEILKGEGIVKDDFEITRRNNGKYNFTISALKSGDATLKVYSVEDPTKSSNVSVAVKTVLKDLVTKQEDSENARSNMFVVKGIKKQIVTSDYFNFDPVEANVCDINWSFLDAEKETPAVLYADNGEIVARIDDGWLTVYGSYSFDTITLRAEFTKNTSVTNTVTFDVLNNSTINEFTMGEDTTIYQNNMKATEEASFELKRNDSNYSTLTGTLIVNSEYDISVKPVVYVKDADGQINILSDAERRTYFGINVVEKTKTSTSSTYKLTIDAYDYDDNKFFGDFYIYFDIEYSDYMYSLSTQEVEIKISTQYMAKELTIYDGQKNVLNNSTIDVFSSYSTGKGFKLNAIVGPDDVALDNNMFYITVDTTQSALKNNVVGSVGNFARFICGGNDLNFEIIEEGSSVFKSDPISSGTDIYLLATNLSLQDVKFNIVSVSNPLLSASFGVNFYLIDSNKTLDVESMIENEDDTFFISSAITSARQMEFKFKINSITTISGLTLKHDTDSRFEFSNLTLSDIDENNEYITVKFTVSLTQANFEGKINFQFEHITGKKSDEFCIDVFVPITNASIVLDDKSLADVYVEANSGQNFKLNDEGNVAQGETPSSSLKKLAVEAGNILPISINYGNASLTENNIQVKFLSYDDLVTAIKVIDGIEDEDTAKKNADNLFKDADFSSVTSYYRYFGDAKGDLFSISGGQLKLTDNEFKGIVCVIFNGYDSLHKNLSIVRFFTLESFYAVKYLSSNVQTKTLYTTETLAIDNISLASVDVTISTRPDTKEPTYFDKSNFAFVSNIGKFVENSYKNNYYEINNISISQGRKLTFKITANSTQLQTSVRDILTITYTDPVSGLVQKTEIQIEIKNMNRVEGIQWLNKTVDEQIYLNLTSHYDSEKSFTISTSVSPNNANDKGISYKYFAIEGAERDLNITTSSTGQIFNLNLNTTSGGYGNLYLLPSDMLKRINGVEKLIVYKYTDTDGQITETVNYIELSKLDSEYDKFINGSEDFDNYFINNDGEKVYYKDLIVKIQVLIADGTSDQTAIRVYNQSDLESIDTALYYQIMNDITLEGWKGYDVLKGKIFGGEDSNITLSFTEGSASFVKENRGIIENLTFVGNVKVDGGSDAGFIANTNSGTIENCKIDVYYDTTSNCEELKKKYVPSKLTSSVRTTGGLVGYNTGEVLNCFVLGATITSTNGSYTGGLVGNNQNVVKGCGIEFYNFVNSENVSYSNYVDANGNSASAMIGFAEGNSVLSKSYAYAYCLQDSETVNVNKNATRLTGDDKDTIDKNTVVFGGTGTAYAFLGGYNGGAKVEECFAFLGNLEKPIGSSTTSTYATFVNSYLTYRNESAIETTIFKGECEFAYADSGYKTNTGTIATLTSTSDTVDNLNTEIWETENIDPNINFEYVYLKEIKQSSPIDVSNLSISDVDGKSLAVDKTNGILFVKKPTVSIIDVVEQSNLDEYNTISIADLFGISSEEAKSVLITSQSSNILLSAGKIKILNKNASGFDVKIHSKMDFTKSVPMKFIILNALPTLTTTVDETVISDNQTVLLQKGKSRNLLHSIPSSIYLGSSGEAYALERDNFELGYDKTSNEYVGLAKSGNTLILTGKKGHENGEKLEVSSYLTVKNLSVNGDENLSKEYNDAIKEKLTRKFAVSVYNGATALIVENANNLEIKAFQEASFNVLMASDNQEDDLVFGLEYNEIDVESKEISDNCLEFAVDNTLVLEVSWTKRQVEEGQYEFSVIVKIKDSQKHLIDKDYDNLTLFLNAESQKDNSQYLRSVNLNVKTQGIDGFSISTYDIKNYVIKNSVLYITPSDTVITTLSPSSDAFVALTVTPAFAKMTHFTLTYSATGDKIGTMNISKLSYNSLYGYYVNSNATTFLDNGIKVSLSDEDRTGNGVFYFRIHISSQFASNSKISLKVTFFDENEEIKSGSKTIDVDYLQDASVKVNGASTYILSKGATATVTIKTERDQSLYSMYLKNNKSDILLSSATEEIFDTYRLYTATLTAKVNATLSGGSTGIFYVYATVQRVLNGVQEIKESRATIYLVDFAIDANEISVKSSGATRTYNGKNYDVVYSYINDTQILNFDYPILPETYSYDTTNAQEVEAVNDLTQKRNQFALTNNYADEKAGYFVNYKLNTNVGLYQALSLKEQLWYASDESNSSAVYNANYDQIQTNDMFTLQRTTVDGKEMLSITGKRSGVQLMKLQTTVICQGTEFVYDYYFLIVVEVYSDEESPTQISSAKEFLQYATESPDADDYILMNDIVLTDWTAISTDLLKSLDGNGFTIHINSFASSTDSTLNLALFDTVSEITTLKNVRVNIYGAGQISVNVSQSKNINIAGFAITNRGIIYNCEVISYYDSEYHTSQLSGESGLMVTYTYGTNTDPIELTDSMLSAYGVESKVAGFVISNEKSIVNSRVGGSEFNHIVEIAGTKYISTQLLDVFTISGQGSVAGFVCENSSNISACFVKDVQINNNTNSDTSRTAGFVLSNTQNVQNSYVEGKGEEFDEEAPVYYNKLTNITSKGEIAGFVYENSGLVKNSYSNIAIENSTSKGSMVAGFVFKNNSDANIVLCFASCAIEKYDINQMQFSGVSDFGETQNYGKITSSYYYNESTIDETTQATSNEGAIALNEIIDVDSFYGFSFSSDEDEYDGIWKMTLTGPKLVSADQIAISNRYAVTVGSTASIFYSKNIMQTGTMKYFDLSYGGENNPIIIRNARDFALATGKAYEKEMSSYKEYYSDTKVFGNYRIVNDVDMSEIGQTADSENEIKLQTTKKTFTGLLDGNGYTISNISLGSSEKAENFGLFAKLEHAVVMNLNMLVESVHNSQANIVGTLAGTVIDSRILSINLSPVTTDEGVADTAVHGNNVVGGLVGMMFGEGKLADISISNIYVHSSYRDVSKNILSNENYTGVSLRENVESGTALNFQVSKISYAGAVAGYVDIYRNVQGDCVKFTTSLQASDYDIAIIHVSDSVNIYGEVAGGLFGYVGNSTYIYDAALEIEADMSLSNPSYITAKNLFAGGLIGENYGALFAASATYGDEIQKNIEENEHSYYKNGNASERGQLTIFSLTTDDSEYSTKTNDPLFVGGLVGYMGGGFIYIASSKLNVVSYSPNTVAVGGVIGLAGAKDVQFDLASLGKAVQANIMLQDVYASGDIFVDCEREEDSLNGISGGIIGAIEKASGQSTTIGLKNVLALNYISVDENGLVGDDTTFAQEGETLVENKVTSNRHFMIAGKIYEQDKEGNFALGNSNDTDIYIVGSDNGYIMAKNGVTNGVLTGTDTVGGYKTILLGNASVELKTFGFSTYEKLDDRILISQHVGSDQMSSMSAAYSRMNNYFLENDWEPAFWKHTESELFPHIELLPTVNVIFWDYYNTEEVLELIKENYNATVVVRGKVEENLYSTEFQDIDFRGKNGETIEAFRGKLVSYYTYAHNDSKGILTIKTEENGKNIGGEEGDRVGIITDKPLFQKLSNNATIEGVNIYLTASDNEGFNLVEESDIAIFKNMNVVINNSMTISSGSEIVDGAKKTYRYGLLTNYAISTSFVNIKITSRVSEGSLLKFESKMNKEDGFEYDVYMGLLAGEIVQKSSSTRVTIQGIEFVSEKRVDVDFEVDKSANSYIGLYAGRISKRESNYANTIVSLLRIDGVNMNIGEIEETEEKGDDNGVKPLAENDSTKTTETAVYIGGYVGSISTVDKVSLVSNDEKVDADKKGINIIQKTNLDKLVAGVGFGNVESDLTIQNDGVTEAWIFGAILQGSKDKETYYTTKTAQLGGLVGYSTNNIYISGFSIDLKISREKGADDNDTTNQSNTFDYKDDKQNYLFDQNLTEYDLHPFTVESGTDNAFGGLVGFVNGGKIEVKGQNSLQGIIDVSSEKENASDETKSVTTDEIEVSVGGLVGKTTSDITTSANGKNKIDIAVSGEKTKAYVGGLVGYVKGTTSSEGTGSNKKNITLQQSSGYTVSGSIISSAKTFKFGGAIGYVDYEDVISVVGVTFGGAVKIFGVNVKDAESNKVTTNSLNGASVSVGGVVGEFDINKKGTFTINKCASYGDVFVLYKTEEGGNYYNWKLSEYNFGGIVGKAGSVTITNCVSLLTNFNDRVTNNSTQDDNGNQIIKLQDNVGAILGSGTINHTVDGDEIPNYYSSGVCMAYQEEGEDIDLAYGSQSGYYGYTTKVTTSESDTSYSATNDNILTKLTELGVSTQGYTIGHKLNPYSIKYGTVTDETDENYKNSFSNVSNANGQFNGISWSALNDNIEITESLENFVNRVLVGNGHTIESSRTEKNNVGGENQIIKAGLIDSFGENQDTTSKGNNVPFTMLSGFIMNLGIYVDLNNTGKYFNIYGGVVGKMQGRSFIYGVGVTGDLSVGGENSLYLAGIAGQMDYGFINECYVDADISYRAGNFIGTSITSGIANIGEYNTTIKATYSSGSIQTYNGGEIYTFAYANNSRAKDKTNENAIQNTADVVDCYSITQIKETQAVADVTATRYFASNIISIGNVLNGCYDVDGHVSIENLAVGYDEQGKSRNSAGAQTTDGYTKWYYTPFTNYGYACHGFGWMKNVTTYTREKATEYTTLNPTYEYTPISYGDVLKYASRRASYGTGEEETEENKWYLGVPNQGKFEQMIDVAKIGNKNYRFVLEYSLDMSQFNKNKYGMDIKSTDFVLDGQNQTLDFSGVTGLSSALFESVTGNIENLRISDMTTEGAATLANSVTGNITNITANGNIYGNQTSVNVGGVVASLTGDATNIDSAVNITVSMKGSMHGFVHGVVGGVVGELTSGKISYASNSGMIVATGMVSNIGVISVYRPSDSYTDDISNYADLVAGGIVGFMNSDTTVENCYNTNAVLSNFTNDKSYDSVAGGVAGYAKGTINSSYNTGFVGAGNASSTAYNMAGGIFGYGSGVTVTGCGNDGAVQAIGYEDGDYTLKTINDGKSIEMTYNPGDFRHVYAYGIGYGDKVTVTAYNNYTTTDNIKNDGNTGECIETKYVFSDAIKKQLLDNDDGALPFSASFDLQHLNVYINGYDSYGFPSRAYIKVNMTRWYSDNQIMEMVGEVDNGEKRHVFGTKYYGTNWSVSYISENDFNEDKRANIPSTTTYALSAEFTTYDKILNCGGILNPFIAEDSSYLVGYSIKEITGSNGQQYRGLSNANKKIDISEKISAIEKARANKTENTTITVNGKDVAIVLSESGLKTLFAPYTVEDKGFTLDFSDMSDGDWNSLSASDFTISDEDNKLQYYDIVEFTKNDITKKVILKLKLYYSESIENGDINVSINYTTAPEEITLGLDNVITYNGNTYILLNGVSGLTEKIVTALQGNGEVDENNDGENEKKYLYNAEVELDGYNITTKPSNENDIEFKGIGYFTKDELKTINNGYFANLEGYEDGIAYLIVPSGVSLENLNSKTLEFTLSQQFKTNVYFDTKVETSEEVIHITSCNETDKFEFADYISFNLTDYVASNYYIYFENITDIIPNEYSGYSKLFLTNGDTIYRYYNKKWAKYMTNQNSWSGTDMTDGIYTDEYVAYLKYDKAFLIEEEKTIDSSSFYQGGDYYLDYTYKYVDGVWYRCYYESDGHNTYYTIWEMFNGEEWKSTTLKSPDEYPDYYEYTYYNESGIPIISYRSLYDPALKLQSFVIKPYGESGEFSVEKGYTGNNFAGESDVETISIADESLHKKSVDLNYGISEVKVKNDKNIYYTAGGQYIDENYFDGIFDKNELISYGKLFKTLGINFVSSTTLQRVDVTYTGEEKVDWWNSYHENTATLVYSDFPTTGVFDSSITLYDIETSSGFQVERGKTEQETDVTYTDVEKLMLGEYASTTHAEYRENEAGEITQEMQYEFSFYANGNMSVKYTFRNVSYEKISDNSTISNPSEEGLYEYNDGAYRLTQDTSVKTNKTYYTIMLGDIVPEESVMYVYDSSKEKIYKVNYSPTDVYEVYEIGDNSNPKKLGLYEYDETNKEMTLTTDTTVKENKTYYSKTSDYEFDYSNPSEYTGGMSVFVDYNGLSVDVVVSSFTEKEIVFARNKSNLSFATFDTYSRDFDTNNATSNTRKISLNSELTTSVTITDKSEVIDIVHNATTNGEMVEGTFEYRKSYDPYFESSSDATINATDFGETMYEYRYERNVKTTIKGISATASGDVLDCDYVLINDDICLKFEGNGFNNDKRIVGNGYILKYIKEGNPALFAANTKKDGVNTKIQDWNIVSISSMRIKTDATYSIFGKNSASIQYVNIYGNIRNISSSAKTVNTFTESDSGTIKNVESNISVNGLDADENESVKAIINISTKKEGDDSYSYDLVVAGDGGNGANGRDGKIADNTIRVDGGNGNNGGNGGSITYDNSYVGYIKTGTAGIGGYGGNGANGKFIDDYGYVIRGGNGGDAGSKGKDGTLTISTESGTDSQDESEAKSLKQCAGNGGAGGVGRIYKTDNLYYTASKAGYCGFNEGEDDSQSKPKAEDGKTSQNWMTYDTKTNYVYFGEAQKIDFSFKDTKEINFHVWHTEKVYYSSKPLFMYDVKFDFFKGKYYKKLDYEDSLALQMSRRLNSYYADRVEKGTEIDFFLMVKDAFFLRVIKKSAGVLFETGGFINGYKAENDTFPITRSCNSSNGWKYKGTA